MVRRANAYSASSSRQYTTRLRLAHAFEYKSEGSGKPECQTHPALLQGTPFDRCRGPRIALAGSRTTQRSTSDDPVASPRARLPKSNTASTADRSRLHSRAAPPSRLDLALGETRYPSCTTTCPTCGTPAIRGLAAEQRGRTWAVLPQRWSQGNRFPAALRQIVN